jgi:choline dehydrogenase-like flavoprotein
MPLGPKLAEVLRATTLQALRAEDRHDAVVVGAGAAGGMAALRLTEAGLRVLVLDAGLKPSPLCSPLEWMIGGLVSRLADPAGMRFIPPRLAYKGRAVLKILARRRQPIQSRCYAWERAPLAFVDDIDCPYTTPPERPFVWLRARQPGGRMTIPGHGRQYYRFGSDDFTPSDGLSPAWPLQPGELDPWYAMVERRLGLTGAREGLPWLPDSELATSIEPTPAEAATRRAVAARWPAARPVHGRYAAPLDSLEIAAATGRLLLRNGAIAREIEVDDAGRVRGVAWIDQKTGAQMRACAPVVFLCASALESTRLLLLSRTPRCPNGLGAASGVLGRGLMDHVMIKAEGTGPRLPPGPLPTDGRCLYLPRFDARELPEPARGRGFGVQLYQFPAPGDRSYFIAVAFAEMLPRPENRVTLDANQCDAWGIPTLRIDCTYSQAELSRAREQTAALRALAEVADATVTGIDDVPPPPGSANHECGTARMGSQPGNSVLDPHNQCWDARGLYVTDGACFPSQGSQNPTLTILALTARACDHALEIGAEERAARNAANTQLIPGRSIS